MQSSSANLTVELLPTRAIRGELPPVQRRPVRGTSACAWNIAVRTRGVFTHRDDSQKPACVERGLVRTGITPVIPESAGPSALCYFEAIRPPRLCAILRARPVYALFLEPLRFTYAILKIKNICIM